MFGRLMFMIRAKLSWLLGEMENPNETLDYSHAQQLELLRQVKRGVADVVTQKKRLEIQMQGLQGSLVKLETQARTALSEGREDLARRALERKSGVQQQLLALDASIESLAEQQEKLVANEQALARKIESFRTEKEVLKAQYSAAKANVKISEAATGIGREFSETTESIGRTRERVESMQARASAMDELVSSGTLESFDGQDPLDRELAALSSNDDVENDLARLRGELEGGKKKSLQTGGKK